MPPAPFSAPTPGPDPAPPALVHPATFYDAKRAAQSAPVDSWDRALHETTIHSILAALGWPTPDPVTDDRGKPVQVWRLRVERVLPLDLHERLRSESQERACAARRRWEFTATGAVAARNKTDVIRRAGVADGSRRSKVSDLGAPLATTDLRYPVAATHPDHLVVDDPAAPAGYILVPLTDLRGTKLVAEAEEST